MDSTSDGNQKSAFFLSTSSFLSSPYNYCSSFPITTKEKEEQITMMAGTTIDGFDNRDGIRQKS